MFSSGLALKGKNVYKIEHKYVICWLGGPYSKNCDQGLDAAQGRGLRAAFSRRGHSFSLYGLTLGRQMTSIFSCSKLVLQITNGFKQKKYKPLLEIRPFYRKQNSRKQRNLCVFHRNCPYSINQR